MDKPIVWSFGGGVQTNAMVILIAKGLLPLPDRIVFADTGGEMSEVWDYMNAYTRPLLRSLGRKIEIATHSLATVDMYSTKGALLIPAYTKTGKLPTFCSKEWKTLVVRRHLGGYEANPDGVIMWLGMSTNEIERLKPSDVKWIEHQWPLCDMPTKVEYGIRMNRMECQKVIEDYGWPPSPRSACVWCPHLDNQQWQRMKTHSPQDFKRASEVQNSINAQDKRGGYGSMKVENRSTRSTLRKNNSPNSLMMMAARLDIVGHNLPESRRI